MAKIVNMEAIKKWNEFPKEFQQRVIDSVFCSKCFVTTIVDYEVSLTEDNFVILKGKCKTCRKAVARVVD